MLTSLAGTRMLPRPVAVGRAAKDPLQAHRRWWNEAHVGAAAAEGLVVVAEADGQIVGVGQPGRSEPAMWSTSSTSPPSIAAVAWAPGT